MRHVPKLRKAIELLGSVHDLTIESRSFQWEVMPPNTFYLEAEYADVHLERAESQQIRAILKLRAAPGWQWTMDQDDAGVYLIAKRKPLIGSIGRASFHITVPAAIHISLNLRHCRLCLQEFDNKLELPPKQ